MARVVAFVPDLLFGSHVQGALAAGGHEVELVGAGAALAGALEGAEVLVLDLTDAVDERLELYAGLRAGGALAGVRTLAFYSHVEPEVRARAEAAGVELVVPRSRMNREGAGLVAGLVAG